MTINDAKALLNRLIGYLEQGSLLTYKSDVQRLYKAVLGKEIPNCNCRDRYADAVTEIYQHFKKSDDMREDTTTRLLNGVVLNYRGEIYTNANITDDVARAFLRDYPVHTDWFAVQPPPIVEESGEPIVRTKKKGRR